MTNVAHLPPRGHYLASEAGRLAGVSGNTIGQWARRGYIRSSQSSGTPRVYSFQDVAEAMLVHELLDRGVRHRDIKRAINELRERYGDWPLSRARLSTAQIEPEAPGRVVAHDDRATYDIGKRGWQQVNEDDLAALASLLQRGGWAARKLRLEHIEVNPNRLSGRPVIRGTRVPAELVAELAHDLAGRETLRQGYGVSDIEMDEALAWWRATQEFEPIAA